MTDEPILAISESADFYPGMREDETGEEYDGTTIEWTFALPRSTRVICGVYRLEFVRTLADEEALGFPVLGSRTYRMSGDDE